MVKLRTETGLFVGLVVKPATSSSEKTSVKTTTQKAEISNKKKAE